MPRTERAGRSLVPAGQALQRHQLQRGTLMSVPRQARKPRDG